MIGGRYGEADQLPERGNKTKGNGEMVNRLVTGDHAAGRIIRLLENQTEAPETIEFECIGS